MSDRLSPEQVQRYQAHLALPRLGPGGQGRLLSSRVLILGVGGLGNPAALYLAAAGVGTLGLVDDDTVDLTNLQRQVLFHTEDVGRSKAEAAVRRLGGLNPDVRLEAIERRVTAGSVAELVEGWDLVLDGTDNFATRYVINDACVLAGVPLVTGSIYRYEGQALVVDPPDGPCYRCLFPSPPGEQAACREDGVLAPLPGVVGTIMAVEGTKLLTGIGATLVDRLLLVDAEEGGFRTVGVRSRADCPLCGDEPTITRPTAVTGDVVAS